MWVRTLGWEDPGEGHGQPAPVFLPGEFHGQRSLVGCRLRGRTELDTTEATQQRQQQKCHIPNHLFSLAFSKCVVSLVG